MHEKYGKDIPYISELACATYEGVHIWAEGVKKAGSIDRMKTIEALETGISYAGPSGQVTIDKPTHHAVRSAYLAVVKDKKWDVTNSYPDQKPLDTAAVCDLVKNPNDNQQYVVKI
jgi:branched-chain amino acid transport system substrate-binding protein